MKGLLREDTFELMVAPAIADLQFETVTGGIGAYLRGYAAVSKAVCGACLHDFGEDARILSEDAADLLTIVVVQVCYYATMLTLIGGAGFSRLSEGELLVLAVMIVGLSALPVIICFWPERYAAVGDANQ
jgi:hypothetical protein